MTQCISVYDAKTRLSALLDGAATSEKIAFAKNGVPHARLVPIEETGEYRVPANAMGLAYVAADFNPPDPTIDRTFSDDPARTCCWMSMRFVGKTRGLGALGEVARHAIRDPGNEGFISAASILEIALKRRLGTVRFTGLASAAIDAYGFHEFAIGVH